MTAPDHVEEPEAKYVREDDITSRAAVLLTAFEESLFRTEKATSAKTWLSGAKTYTEWLWSTIEKEPEDAERPDLTAYFEYVRDEFAPNTQGGKYHGVEHFYDWMVRYGLREVNPVDQLPREDFNIGDGGTIIDGDEGYTAISREEVEEVIDHVPAPSTRNRLIAKLFWFTGVRAVELCRIRIKDIDRDEGRISIRNAKKVSDRMNNRRDVWYPTNRVKWDMQDWLDNDDRDALSPHADESDYLFLTHQSEKMRPSHVSRIIKEAGKNAGLNEVVAEDRRGRKRWKIRSHTLRHSFCSYHANVLETPLHHLKEVAGHLKYETTLRYVEEDTEARQRAMQEPWM